MVTRNECRVRYFFDPDTDSAEWNATVVDVEVVGLLLGGNRYVGGGLQVESGLDGIGTTFRFPYLGGVSPIARVV